MKKTVMYTRQSLDAEKQKNSLDVQKSLCKEYALKHGWIIHDCYDEGEKSARTTKVDSRPELSRLLFDADKGMIERLIVYKRDRLARNVEQYLEVINRLQKSNVAIQFVADNEPPIIDGPIGEFVELLLAGLAQQEGENIHRRQMEARHYLAGNGQWAGTKLPLGYQSKNHKTEKVEEKARIIKLYYEKFDACWSENKSLNEIVNEMRNYPEIKDITKQKLINSIPREIYKGVLRQKLEGKEYGPHTRSDLKIIENDIWDNVNQKLRITCPDLDREIEKESYTPLLNGKVECGKCNEIFKKGNKYYICQTCKRKIPIIKFEEFVLDKIVNHLKEFAAEKQHKIVQMLKDRFLSYPEKEKMNIEKKLSEIEEKIKAAMEAVLNGQNCKDTIDFLVQSYKDNNENLKKHLTRALYITKTIEHFSKDKTDLLMNQNLNYEVKKELLSVLDKVIFKESTTEFYYFDGKKNERR